MPGPDDAAPVSAGKFAALLGDQLPDASSIDPAALDLVVRVRELVEAVVMTDVAAGERAAVAAQIAEATKRLRAARRDDALFLVRHEDGRVESLLQAGSGRLNPQAPPVEWLHRPTEPPAGTTPVAVEVTARCTFNAAHAGSPGRVYGGVVASVLDEVLGVAVRASGAGGMTVALNVSLRGGTPFGVPVDIAARYTGGEGRKSYASGEVRVDGVVTTEATAVFVGER